MKKKDKKVDSSELKSLSDEFGIEPPKIYSKEQSQRMTDNYNYNSNIENSESIKKSKTKKNKSKQKRKLKRKYRKILYSILVALCLIFVLIILSLTVLFKIETITVEGDSRYDTAEIVQNIPIETQSNLFLADTKNAKKMLESNLPYLYEVNVKRKLPAKIIVEVRENDVFYAAKNIDSTYILMDDNFKVLEINLDTQPENALFIDSVAIDSANVGQKLGFSDDKIEESIISVNNIIKKLRICEITAIYATDSEHNYAIYDNRLVINLGNDKNLENKLYAALAIIDKLESNNPLIEGEVNVSKGKQYYFTENNA